MKSEQRRGPKPGRRVRFEFPESSLLLKNVVGRSARQWPAEKNCCREPPAARLPTTGSLGGSIVRFQVGVVLQGAQGCSQWLTRASQRFGRLYDIGCSADNSLEVPAA